MRHELKIQKQWADAKLAGEKPFEIRINDRGFQKGDTVRYRVVDPKTGAAWTRPPDDEAVRYGLPATHPLESCEFVITYVMQGFDGMAPGYCVFADCPVAVGKGPGCGGTDRDAVKDTGEGKDPAK